MSPRTLPNRAGITLVEILISILILGVGIIALASLFPLGLIRLRTAARWTRSSSLSQSARADLSARNLLNKFSFLNPITTPYVTGTAAAPNPYDPWVQDTPAYGADWYGGGTDPGAYRGAGGTPWSAPFQNGNPAFPTQYGPGLPVAYDPLWRSVTNVFQNNLTAFAGTESRFGAGHGFLRTPASGNLSADGLQRLTNALTPALASRVAETFISHEDVVFQEPSGSYVDPSGSGRPLPSPSPLAPDLSQVQPGAAAPRGASGAGTSVYPPQLDWRYSWMFTGAQTDALNGTIFDGQIVVFENRQFGNDPVAPPFAGAATGYQPTGETTVEAIWGYGGNVVKGYAVAARRTVLLLWPTAMPDPDIRVGHWIADVTYERNELLAQAAYGPATGAIYPAQRCHWYQISKRTDPTPSNLAFLASAGVPYRQLTVWVSSDLKAQSRLTGGGVSVSPVDVEAALIVPSVVNAIPRTIYTH